MTPLTSIVILEKTSRLFQVLPYRDVFPSAGRSPTVPEF